MLSQTVVAIQILGEIYPSIPLALLDAFGSCSCGIDVDCLVARVGVALLLRCVGVEGFPDRL